MKNDIQFDVVATLPPIDYVNATDNWNGPGSNTTLWINISDDSNVNVTFCIMSDNPLQLKGGAYFINESNITYKHI